MHPCGILSKITPGIGKVYLITPYYLLKQGPGGLGEIFSHKKRVQNQSRYYRIKKKPTLPEHTFEIEGHSVH